MRDAPAGARSGAARLADRRGLLWTMVLTGVVMVAEIAGGVASNSLALLSDAGHMFTDVLALGLAVFALTMAARPAPARVSYGYYRIEILAALANGVLLALIAAALFYNAYLRFLDPPPVEGPIVLAVAAAGLAANVGGLVILRTASRRCLNVRGAAMHVLGDALSSAAVLVCGAVITTTRWYAVDPLLSAGIGVGIVVGAVRLVREAVDVLLEASPAGIDLGCVRDDIREVRGVLEVHDLHIWSITSGMAALSGHVVLDGAAISRSDETLNAIKTLLRERYRIDHTTIQVESEAYREIGEVHLGVK